MKAATRKFLEKAAQAIEAAQRLLESGHTDFAAGRAYYAMFYAAEALLCEVGRRFRKHGGVHAAFAEQFIKTGELDKKYHRWLVKAFERRIVGDYGIEEVITAREAEGLIEQAREFLQAARRYLGPAS